MAGETATHVIHIIPMIYNHRVVLTPKGQTGFYDVGWCYPDLDTALQALREWDPISQEEPDNYIKRVG